MGVGIRMDINQKRKQINLILLPKKLKIKFLFLFQLLFIANVSYAQNTLLNETYFKTEKYDVIFTNHSIVEFGTAPNLDVYSSIDIQALLAISNAISSEKVALVTKWDQFNPPPMTSLNFNEAQFKNLPEDVKRILFLGLTWNESERLNLFVIPDEALENVSQRMIEERPWKTYEMSVVKKIDSFSKETLKDFIYVVLRANVFQSVRGDLLNNKSLLFINWNWLVANKGIVE